MSLIRRTLGIAALIVYATLFAAACGNPHQIRPGHSATIACGQDGEVHATISNYGAGQYTLNGGAPIDFQGGAIIGPLDGAVKWTMVVTADDWPTWTGSAGPCRYRTTTTSTTTTSTAPPTTATTTTTAPATTTTTVESTSSTSSTTSTTTTEAPSEDSTSTVPTTPPTTAPPAPPAPPAPVKLPVTR